MVLQFNKWNPAKLRSRPPLPFAQTYPEASFQTVHSENYGEFLAP